MKEIIIQPKKEQLKFTCDNCGAMFISDEYIEKKRTTTNASLIDHRYKEECPNCNHLVKRW